MIRGMLPATTAILAAVPTAAVARAAPSSPAAQAETAPGSSAQAADAQAAPASEGLNDIVVTAQRKAENLQRAAVAVGVI